MKIEPLLKLAHPFWTQIKKKNGLYLHFSIHTFAKNTEWPKDTFEPDGFQVHRLYHSATRTLHPGYTDRHIIPECYVIIWKLQTIIVYFSVIFIGSNMPAIIPTWRLYTLILLLPPVWVSLDIKPQNWSCSEKVLPLHAELAWVMLERSAHTHRTFPCINKRPLRKINYAGNESFLNSPEVPPPTLYHFAI